MSEKTQQDRIWRRRAGLLWHEWAKPLLLIAVVLGSLRSAVADWNDVPTGSMRPTILEGDRIFVNKLAYDLKVPFTLVRLMEWSQPTRGDIVVFYSPDDGTRLVKRVVGLPGDTVAVKGGQLWVNGRRADYGELSLDTTHNPREAHRSRHWLTEETLDGRPHRILTGWPRVGGPDFGPARVPEGEYFMLGDHRDNSLDSRWYGTIPRDQIVGRATAVVASVDLDRYWMPRWSRFLTTLD